MAPRRTWDEEVGARVDGVGPLAHDVVEAQIQLVVRQQLRRPKKKKNPQQRYEARADVDDGESGRCAAAAATVNVPDGRTRTFSLVSRASPVGSRSNSE